MGVATTLIPVQQSYFGLIIYAVIFGMSESCFIVMIPLITKDIVGVQRLPLAIGCVFMLMGIPTVVGAPIAGEHFFLLNYSLQRPVTIQITEKLSPSLDIHYPIGIC